MTAKEVKELSERRIEKLGLTVNKNLPTIEKFTKLKFQNGQDIARRILVLTHLIQISFNIKRTKLKNSLREYQLEGFVSGNEKKILTKWFLTKQDRIDASWLSESIEVLGWTIGLWNTIDPLKPCDEDKQILALPLKKNPIEFINSAQLIDKVEIYKEADFIYRLHWTAKRQTFGELKTHHNDIYSERHKAINWIIEKGTEWDDITTDT